MNEMEDKAPSWFNQTPGSVWSGEKTYSREGFLTLGQYAGVVCGRCEDSRVEQIGTPSELVIEIIGRGWRSVSVGWICPACVASMKGEFFCESCEKEKGRSDARNCHHEAGQRWRASQEEKNETLPAWRWGDGEGNNIHLRVMDTDKGRAIKVFCDDGLTMDGRIARLMSMWIVKQTESEQGTRPDRENALLVAVVRSAVSDHWHVYAKEGKVHARYTGDGVHNVYPEFVMGNEPIGDFVTLLNQYRP